MSIALPMPAVRSKLRRDIILMIFFARTSLSLLLTLLALDGTLPKNFEILRMSDVVT
jgi:hypothetical protein